MDPDEANFEPEEPLNIDEDLPGDDGDPNIAAAAVAPLGGLNVESTSSSNHQAALRALAVASVPGSSSHSSPNNIGRSSSTTLSHQAMLRQQAHGPASAIRQDVAAGAAGRRSPSTAAVPNININDNSRALAAAPNNNDFSSYLGLAGAAVALPSSSRSNTGSRSISVPEHAVNDEEGSPISAGANGWCTVETNGGTPPSARSLHAAALLNGVMYVFGGYDGLQRVNTFHAFSFAEKRWSPVLPSSNSANPPSPRDRHVSVAFGNSFYVHGGFDGTSRVSDFWSFDFSSMTWREVVVLQGRAPSPRHSHAAVVHRNSLYIFGVSFQSIMFEP